MIMIKCFLNYEKILIVKIVEKYFKIPASIAILIILLFSGCTPGLNNKDQFTDQLSDDDLETTSEDRFAPLSDDLRTACNDRLTPLEIRALLIEIDPNYIEPDFWLPHFVCSNVYDMYTYHSTYMDQDLYIELYFAMQKFHGFEIKLSSVCKETYKKPGIYVKQGPI